MDLLKSLSLNFFVVGGFHNKSDQRFNIDEFFIIPKHFEELFLTPFIGKNLREVLWSDVLLCAYEIHYKFQSLHKFNFLLSNFVFIQGAWLSPSPQSLIEKILRNVSRVSHVKQLEEIGEKDLAL